MKATQLERDLKEMVGDRFTTNALERSLYRRDLQHISFADRLVDTLPSAIVSPEDAKEVATLLKYCSDNAVPLTARGAGSSGLFGSVPKRGGIVLDLRALLGEIVVDSVNQCVKAPAGVTWWELERRLNKSGVTLMSYPSSALSATLGGWAATTGLGIGNLRYGPLAQQLLAADIALADGSLQSVEQGKGLGVFMGSEGLLGVMTAVNLKFRAIPQASLHQLVHLPKIDYLSGFLNSLTQMDRLPYAIEFFDSGYLHMLEKAAYRVAGSGDGGCLVLVSMDGDKAETEEDVHQLARIVAESHGELKPGGEVEWDQRFKMMRVRRAVPSLTVGSVHLPMIGLAQFVERCRQFGSRPMGLVGHVVSGSECVVMALTGAQSDRGIKGALALTTPAELSQMAISLGGGPGGGLGLWNAAYRHSMALKDKAAAIEKKKKEVDPKGILNPGMWTRPPFLLKKGVFGPAIAAGRSASALFSGTVKEKNNNPELENCVQCGYCMGYCPTRGRWLSSTPRGRVLTGIDLSANVGGQEEPDAEAVKDIFECTLCGRCKVDCSVDIKSPEMWSDLRTRIVDRGGRIEALDSLSSTILSSHNLAGKPNEQRGKWADGLKLDHLKPAAETAYFVGCVTAFYPMVQDVAKSFARILDGAGIDFAILGGEEWCCGYPLLSAGHGREASEHVRANVDRMVRLGVKRILTTCPGCLRMWKRDYHRITGKEVPFAVQHSTEVIAGLLASGNIKVGDVKARVTYHDPCDLGRNAGIYDQPRHIMSRIGGIELVELESNREYCNCCGSGGDLLASNQELSMSIGSRKVKEILGTSAETVVTACPSCERAINMAKLSEKARFKVLDITQLTWSAMIK